MSIYKASRLACINNATAKDIIRKYRKSGTVFVRKDELAKYQERTHQTEDGMQESRSLPEENHSPNN
jgi:hypothetical protein